jgi:hypothetical protein
VPRERPAAAATILFDHLPAPAFFDRRTVELGAASEGRVNLVVLNAAPPLLAGKVIARGRLLMCRDEDERDVLKLMRKDADIPMDFADACLVDMASDYQTGRILTLDADFYTYRWGRNRPFELLLSI